MDTFDSITNRFSFDLVTNARNHVEFLKVLHEYHFANANDSNNANKCDDATYALESLRRYQQLWLPLAASVASTTKTMSIGTSTTEDWSIGLHPPPDIAWLWHCHRLAPKNYIKYCNHRFGCIIEANPPFSIAQPSLTEQEDVKRTMNLWTEMHPQESFFIDAKNIIESSDMNSFTPPLLCGFDLLGSIDRQKNFLWQVSGERFSDEDFLEDGVVNYYRFLKLKPTASKQGIILVPTYQIDLMWHTHILTSINAYNTDCIRISNATMNHDDSLTDRSEGGVLDVSFAATKSLWKNEYGTDYLIAGGMYRGEPPHEYFTPEWRSYNDCLQYIAMDVALLGRTGASSTTDTGPTQWASLDGVTSNGSPAFIPSDRRYNELSTSIYKKDYVLGRNGVISDGWRNRVTGYFHVETREANYILRKRLDFKLSALESELAFQKSCCGNLDSFSLQQGETRRKHLLECRSILRERIAADRPNGATTTVKIDTTRVYRIDGVWMYPPILYSCAGGSCGGLVCTSGASREKATACGSVGGACGSGGGGGCGGGGCGGGGGGGGGCG